MANVTIDGRAVEFQPGETIIRAALRAGIEIPYYCWHPRLSVAANCRMCLVEIEKAPKLQPACEVVCREGQVIQTRSPKVLEARAAVMEFMLINHPIDCPICDQAGECKLQDYYMKHDRSGTRFDEVKVPKNKVVHLGPTVVLDEERCINCTRCVRFMAEVAKNPQLGQFDRGDRAVIGVFPGQPLDDPYSANVADICPVGALTNADFRFKCRSWFLTKTDSVCPGCARGCSITIDHNDNVVQRLKPRDNDAVNQGWMCDEGRLTYKRVHDAKTQITEPHALVNGKLAPISWDQAKQRLTELLGPFVGQADGTLALALSAQLTTEGVAAFVELAEQVVQVDTYAILGQPDGWHDQFLRVADQNPNRAGAELVLEAYSIFDEGPELLMKAIETGAVTTLIMVGTDYPNADDRWKAALDKARAIVAFSSNWDASAERADLVIPLASWAEQDGTFVNTQGRMQRIHRALMPIHGRKSAVEAAAFVADAVGAGPSWTLRTWTAAFNALKKHTNLLRDVKATELGAWGVALEAKDPEKPADPAEAPRAQA
ncbi:2Fe-2S iron-sulfur cluster-binding protein [Myxococcota bacterium]|nr:2Fe-2S iron-sulfur cluster-binding protein [Myxococcota bacterium]